MAVTAAAEVSAKYLSWFPKRAHVVVYRSTVKRVRLRAIVGIAGFWPGTVPRAFSPYASGAEPSRCRVGRGRLSYRSGNELLWHRHEYGFAWRASGCSVVALFQSLSIGLLLDGEAECINGADSDL